MLDMSSAIELFSHFLRSSFPKKKIRTFPPFPFFSQVFFPSPNPLQKQIPPLMIIEAYMTNFSLQSFTQAKGKQKVWLTRIVKEILEKYKEQRTLKVEDGVSLELGHQ